MLCGTGWDSKPKRDYRQRILRTLETASPSLTKRYEPVFTRLAVVKGLLRLATYQHETSHLSPNFPNMKHRQFFVLTTLNFPSWRLWVRVPSPAPSLLRNLHSVVRLGAEKTSNSSELASAPDSHYYSASPTRPNSKPGRSIRGRKGLSWQTAPGISEPLFACIPGKVVIARR